MYQALPVGEAAHVGDLTMPQLRTLCWCLPAVLCATWLSADAAEPAGGEAPKPATPEKVPPADAATLVREFNRQRTDCAKRREIARKLHAVRPEAVKAIVVSVGREFDRALDAYFKSFTREAQNAVREQVQQAHKKQLIAWQRIVRKRRTQEQMRTEVQMKVMPAMRNLREVLCLDANDARTISNKLTKQRVAAIELYDLQHFCRSLLSSDGDAAADAGDEKPDDEGAGGAKDAKKKEDTPKAKFRKTLAGLEYALAMMAMRMKSSERAVMDYNWRLRNKVKAHELVGVVWANVTRALSGVRLLKLDMKLYDAAIHHCIDMRKHKFLGSASPVKGKRTCQDRARKAGTTATFDLIAKGTTDAPMIIDRFTGNWLIYKAMMDPGLRRMAAGEYEKYWTIVFGK